MSADLGSLLALAVEELSPSDGLDDTRLLRVVRSVRRRRIRRHTVESAVGVAAASVVGTAVWAGLRLAPAPVLVPPAVMVTPTVTSTPTVTASPTTAAPTPSSTPEAPVVPISFGQPLSAPVTDSLFASASEGWSLALVTPAYRVDGSTEEQSATTSLYLLSPTGDRYKVLDLPENMPMMVNQLVHWEAGAPQVWIDTFTQDGVHGYAWLDLRTGELTGAPGPTPGAAWIGLAANGSTIWDADGVYYVVAPDGTTTSQTAAATLSRRMTPTMDPTRTYLFGDAGMLDLETGRVQPVIGAGADVGACNVDGWLDDTHPMLRCAVGDSSTLLRTVFAPASASIIFDEPVFADPSMASAEGVESLPDGRLVGTMTVDGVYGVFAVTPDGTATLIQDVGQAEDTAGVDLTVVGSTVFINQGEIVTAHDLASARSYELTAMPTESGAQYGLGPLTWTGGPRSWVMGTSW